MKIKIYTITSKCLEFVLPLWDSNKLLFQNKAQDFSKTCTQRLLLQTEIISALNSPHCPNHNRGCTSFPAQSTVVLLLMTTGSDSLGLSETF